VLLFIGENDFALAFRAQKIDKENFTYYCFDQMELLISNVEFSNPNFVTL